MREIKFRYWCKLKEKMDNHPCDMPGDIEITIINDYFKEDPNRIFMQYTGLKDKNGKEIYEGDVINYCGVHIDFVEFEDGAFWILSNDACIKADINMREVEVIGNIYENPELLEK